MSTVAIRGRYHNGTVEPMEAAPVEGDADVVIVFLSQDEEKSWEEAITVDFLSGYGPEDTVYDNL